MISILFGQFCNSKILSFKHLIRHDVLPPSLGEGYLDPNITRLINNIIVRSNGSKMIFALAQTTNH